LPGASEESGLEKLVVEGNQIADQLQQVLLQPGLPDMLKLLAPFFTEGEELDTARHALDQIKSQAVLSQVRSVLTQYQDWQIRCDHEFTKRRCRSDRRVARFISLGKIKDKFLRQKTSSQEFVLSVREQVSLLKSISTDPKPRPKKKVSRQKKAKEEPSASQMKKYDTLLRKTVQAILLGVAVSIIVSFGTVDPVVILQAFSWSIAAFLIAMTFEVVRIVTTKETRSAQYAGYFLQSGYVISFFTLTPILVPSSTLVMGDLTIPALFLMLVLSELVVRWGPLQVLVRAADYLRSGLIVLVCIVIAYIISFLLNQPIWVGASLLAAIWSFWNNSRAKRSLE
jgi:hypothetical protein